MIYSRSEQETHKNISLQIKKNEEKEISYNILISETRQSVFKQERGSYGDELSIMCSSQRHTLGGSCCSAVR